jgi:hypothetical protein
MRDAERPTAGLQGRYHDVLLDPQGRVIWDRGWWKNTIVVDCRRLLAGFMHGAPTNVLGIQGLQVGAGLEAWDPPGAPPAPNPAQVALVDPNPFTVPLANLQIDYLSGAAVSASPTNRLQILAALGPGVPPWPDPNHATSALREFGLAAQLNGATILLNHVIHPRIVKDPFSTLQRTIWLVF